MAIHNELRVGRIVTFEDANSRCTEERVLRLGPQRLTLTRTAASNTPGGVTWSAKSERTTTLFFPFGVLDPSELQH